jgi:hypothetical protein
MEADQDSRNHSKRAYWIKYRLTAHLPLKLAVISDFSEFVEGPGEWIRLVLHRLQWRRLIHSAKITFSRQYDERHELGFDRARHVPVHLQ